MKTTSVVPWPVTQNRAMDKVLEVWRLIIMENLHASLVGRQIADKLTEPNSDVEVTQIIRFALTGKSIATLRARSSSLI